MRKADYATLARIIRAALAWHEQDAHTRATIEGIAREFAQAARVDKVAFLKACGIQ